jgi:hypothetical protein
LINGKKQLGRSNIAAKINKHDTTDRLFNTNPKAFTPNASPKKRVTQMEKLFQQGMGIEPSNQAPLGQTQLRIDNINCKSARGFIPKATFKVAYPEDELIPSPRT